MKYLYFLLLSYIAYLTCKPEEGEEGEEGEEEEEEGEEDKKKDFGKMVICDNECLKNSGYLPDKGVCGQQPPTNVNPKVECIPINEDKKEKKKEEGEEEGGEEEGSELKSKKK